METDQPLPTTVQVDFTLAIGAGRLDVTLPVPSGEVTITELLPVLQSLTSSIVDSTVQVIHTEGYQVSCRAGCGACCRQMVPISPFEAEALAAWIRTLPLERQQELQARFHSALLTLHGSGILARLDPEQWVDGSPEAVKVSIDYLAQKTPCPFLEDESCSIHPMRPLSCREYLVTSPPEFCAAPSNNPVVGVPLPIRPSKLLFKIGALAEHNRRGWIPLIFLFAWMKGETHPGDTIKGIGPELLYEFVKHLEHAWRRTCIASPPSLPYTG